MVWSLLDVSNGMGAMGGPLLHTTRFQEFNEEKGTIRDEVTENTTEMMKKGLFLVIKHSS